MTTKYTILKSITLSAVLQADQNNGCFREQFNRFLNEFAKTNTIDFWRGWGIDDLVAWFRYIPDLENWLVKHEFIKADRRYYVNQVFASNRFPDRLYMIVQIHADGIGLLRLPKRGVFKTYYAHIFVPTRQVDDLNDIPPDVIEDLFHATISCSLSDMKDVTPKGD